jgi:hypothetical protein
MSTLSFFLPLLRWKKTLITLASLLLLYTVTGFFILPAVLHRQLPRRLGALLGRPVSLQRARCNPYALSVTLEGFQVKDPDGQPFLAWERLYVNIQASSLFTRTLSFSAIHLERPSGRVVLERGGRLNFSDVLDRLKSEPKAAPSHAGPSRELFIGSLSIQSAQMQLLDRSLATPFATTLGPLTIEIQNFRTERDSQSPYTFKGHTESGESFAWTGSFSAEPLRSRGTLSLENLALPKYQPYYQDQVGFELRKGQATVRASYVFEWTEGRHILQLLEGSLDLTDLQLAAPGQAQIPLEWPTVEARGIRADLLENTAGIASLHLRDGRIQVARLPNGEIDLLNLLVPKPRPKPQEPGKPFQFTLKELSLTGFQVDFEDRATVRPVRSRIQDLEVTVKDFSLDPKASCDLSMALGLEAARIQAEGSLMPFKPSADLRVKIERLALAPFDPYLDPATDIRVNRGNLSLEGRVRMNFEGKAADHAAFDGRLRLDDFEAMDGAQQEPFVRYKALRLEGLELNTNPQVLKLKGADLLEPEYRMVIAKDGSNNVARAMKVQSGSNLAAVAGAPAPEPPGAPFAVSIGKVRMQKGRLSFVDRSIEPSAALLISDLEGTNTGLSTSPDDTSSLELKGLVGGLAPILIQGQAMPLRHDKDTDITVKISGADLTDFSPYAGQQVGYAIQEGKLDLFARVRIQDRKLKIEDKLRLDRFYLGDKVPSPEATRLPVKLGLALLRDRKGVIELEVPVDGSLDDPDIHYGRMVWKALFNALGKVVASPFTLISKLVGSDADLSHAAFAPGSSILEAGEQKKLTDLAKALQERPELRLEVESTTDGSDEATLRHRQLEALLRRAEWKARKPKDQERPEKDSLDPSERERALRAAFEAAFPAPPTPDAKPVAPPPIAEMEQRLLGTLVVNPEELRSIAEARSLAAITALKQSGVDPSRIFEVRGSETARAGGCRTHFALK